MNQQTEANDRTQLRDQINEIEDLIGDGNYDRALTLGRELLDAHPDRGEPYTVIGDIYAARDMWPEAVEWYIEGVERDDSSAPDKLRDARSQLILQLEQPGQPRRTRSASQTERERTKLWITLASAGAVVVIAVVIASLTFSSKPPPSAIGQTAAQGTTASATLRQGARSDSNYQRSTASVARNQLRGQPEAGSQIPDSGTRPDQSSVSAIKPQPTPTKPEESATTTIIVQGPRTERDVILESALGSLTWPGGTAMRDDVAVALDPFLGYAMITFEIPHNPGGSDLAEIVARQAYSVAAAAINTDASIKTLTLRGIIDLSSSRRRRRAVVAYRGNTSRESLEYWLKHDRSPSNQQLWNQVFAATWWNQAIPRTGLE